MQTFELSVFLNLNMKLNNKVFYKHYNIKKADLDVRLHEKLISFDFTSCKTNEEINLIYNEIHLLIKYATTDYELLFGKPLGVKKASLKAEIWGHLIVYKLCIYLRHNFTFLPIKKLLNIITERSATVDCGEAGIDANRWLWDTISPFFNAEKPTKTL